MKKISFCYFISLSNKISIFFKNSELLVNKLITNCKLEVRYRNRCDFNRYISNECDLIAIGISFFFKQTLLLLEIRPVLVNMTPCRFTIQNEFNSTDLTLLRRFSLTWERACKFLERALFCFRFTSWIFQILGTCHGWVFHFTWTNR